MASTGSQFRLLRKFSMTSVVLAFVLTVGVVFAYDRHQTTTLLRRAEKENVSLARSFANAIWSRHGQYLGSARNISGDALRTLPNTAALDQDLRFLANGLHADSDEVARVYRYEVARGFRDDVAHLSDLISPGGEAF